MPGTGGVVVREGCLEPFDGDVLQGVLVASEIPLEGVDGFNHHLQQTIFFPFEQHGRFLEDHVRLLNVTVQTDIIGQKGGDAVIIQALNVT